MPAEPSKYAENQFESATRKRFALMDEFLADLMPRATVVTTGIADFAGPMGELSMLVGAWNGASMAWANASAALPASTFAFEDKIASLTRTPDANTPSPLESWDATIRTQVAYQGPVYMSLLPDGRESFTTGAYELRLTALENLAAGLAAQSTKPVLVSLGATVNTFATAVRALRDAQTVAKSNVETTRNTLDSVRIGCAKSIYKLIGCGMMVWNATPEQVDSLFDVGILRRPVVDVPDAPVDTLWTPATRTLSTTTMPARGSRLEAWRIAPGGMPEQLHTGGFGETSVLIPATITWVSGGLYQIWLVALNASGPSAAGPIQNWTAP